ncbi:MAG: SpoIIE family protein phosphatase [Paludibacteraceae bacterium]|nr:SpoIIE family protein phosphatase [Paludibacteraceae bacterium]
MKKIKWKNSNARSGIWIILVAAVVLEATSFIQYFYSRKGIQEEAEQLARCELRRAELEIEVQTARLEEVAEILATLGEKYVDCPDSAFSSTRLVAGGLKEVSSLAIAYIPDYFPEKGRWYEVCSSRLSDGSVYTRQIGSEAHDYFQAEWFNNGLRIDSCWWSEPYLDDSGSQAMVVSCSRPVHDHNGKVVAVVCVDLSLEYLQNLSEYLRVYPESSYSIRSSKGLDIVSASDTVPGKRYHVFDEEIDATGWHISIIIPDAVIYAGLRRIGLIVTLMMIVGLGLLIFIVVHAGKAQVQLVESTAQNERMESELQIARDIQMSMLPKFDKDIRLKSEMFGVVIPAKEVGGDLYDFFVADDILYFCIGDVSGKGVPAAFVMATTRSLFRAFSVHETDVARIVAQMNNAMADTNGEDMFVTFFMGALNLKTGVLNYCNAGHNAPVWIGTMQGAKTLSCLANLPLGILSGYAFTAQTSILNPGDTFFLYTDGLSEAEDKQHAQYGEEHMMQEITRLEGLAGCTSEQLVNGMLQSVQQFVGDAVQSDDLTMLAVRFVPEEDADAQKVLHDQILMRNDIQQIPTLAEWMEGLDLPVALNMTLNLALEEAVTNVMLYAYPEDKSGTVLIEAEKTDEQITFVISDSGKPFDPTQIPPVDTTLGFEERAIGGLGIHLVRQIMDSIEYRRENDKNILTLVKKLKNS